MPGKKQRTSAKGIHENLKALAKNGRVRFHGGWLNDSAQDRFIAEWINRTPEAWAVMKAILYQSLTGGGGVAPRQAAPAESDTPGEAASVLLDFDD